MTPASRGACAALLLSIAVLLAGCGPEPAPEPSPTLVLVTLGNLRADLVGSLGGEPGWTPELDRFAAEASWSGRGIAPSSSPVTSVAGLATGVDPWQHGVLSHLFHSRHPDLPTLGEIALASGLATTLVISRHEGLGRFGVFDGFEEVIHLEDNARVEETLQTLGEKGPAFLWLHLPQVAFPYRDRREQRPDLPAPERTEIRKAELIPFADPDLDLPEQLARSAGELYRHEVALADVRIGKYLDALRRGDAWNRATIVLTALHGTELGERGQALFAQNLGRESIEVPLILRRAQGKSADFGDGPVAVAGLWATLAEEIGHPTAPVHLPSLDRRSDLPILSSLYLHDAKNRFSIITREGDEVLQLTLATPFAPPEPEFFPAQAVEAGRRDIRLTEPVTSIRRRLTARFRAAAPFSGLEGSDRERTVELVRWPAKTGSPAVEDPVTERLMTQALEGRWSRFVDRERSPDEELRRRTP